MNNRELGTKKEKEAAAYLEQHGLKILEYNFRSKIGEIDLIGYQDKYLVFVEVKYRGTKKMGYASEAVTPRKQHVICRVSDYYRLCRRVGDNIGVRFDVVAIQGEEITWIKNAFPYHTSI